MVRCRGVHKTEFFSQSPSCLFPKEFWPIPSTPKGIITHPAHSRRNYNQPHPFQEKFSSISATPKGILTNLPIPERIMSKSVCSPTEFWPILLLLKELQPTSPTSHGILTNPFWLKSPRKESHPLLKEFWLILPIPSCSRMKSDQSRHSWRKSNRLQSLQKESHPLLKKFSPIPSYSPNPNHFFLL